MIVGAAGFFVVSAFGSLNAFKAEATGLARPASVSRRMEPSAEKT